MALPHKFQYWEDFLARSREEGLAQGMTTEEAEAFAQENVFGTAAQAEQYRLTKAEAELQGASQEQTDADNDAMMGRIQQSELIAADEAQAAEAEAQQARDASFLPTHLRSGYDQQKQAVNE